MNIALSEKNNLSISTTCKLVVVCRKMIPKDHVWSMAHETKTFLSILGCALKVVCWFSIGQRSYSHVVYQALYLCINVSPFESLIGLIWLQSSLSDGYD